MKAKQIYEKYFPTYVNIAYRYFRCKPIVHF